MRAFTIGHRTRPADELVECLRAAGVRDPHGPSREAEARDGRLHLCGELVG